MDTTPSGTLFDEAYTAGNAPWVIGGPQPVIVELERAGLMGGAVLDVGCGTGEHTMHLAELGYDVLGVDASSAGIERARAIAAGRGVEARFALADALDLSTALGAGRDGVGSDGVGPDRVGPDGAGPLYDTVLDSALFHIWDAGDRVRYATSLHRVCRPGAVVHLLALSDAGPGFGPQVSDAAIRETFGEGWRLEVLGESTYRGAVLRPEHSALLGRPIGDLVDLPAWLARIRRL